MHETEDIELLRQFADEESDAAFETLVKRHVNLVYSAALRSLHNLHQAEEITQAVFVILARKARTLRKGTILSGWLYQTARLTAANFLRTEVRRAHREKEAHMQSLLNDTNPDPWPLMTPLLEHAMGGLNEKDRNAVVLRFFEKKSLSEIGQAFGMSEDAAKMRVNRAVEKLRKFFTKRGITLSASVLAGAVSTHSIQAAPMGLAATVAAAGVNGSAVAVPALTLAKGTLKLMAWTKAKMAIAVGAGVLLAGGTTGTLATLALMKWEAYKAYRDSARSSDNDFSVADSWRNPNNDFFAVEKAAPQVRILPTKFRDEQKSSNSHGVVDYNLKGNPSGLKWVGIAVPVEIIASTAYECRPARVLFDTPPPQDRYDFITSLPQGSLEALQQELKAKLGYVGRWETREANVLLLKVRNPNATGLKPATLGGTQNWGAAGRYYCDDVPLSSTNRALQGLANFLEQAFRLPVIDQTGLTQHFNIDLKWDARHPSQTDAVKQAMLNRLGLELVPGRKPIEILALERTR